MGEGTVDMRKGYIQVYTGEGKGKTTASIGLAIRAAGAGHKVFLAQFIKGKQYSEINALQRFDDLITVEQFGLGRFINGKCAQSDIDAARNGLDKMKKIVSSGEYQVVVLDEANIAIKYDMFSVNELIDLIDSKTSDCEIIITGRYACQEIIDRADLVTEMRPIKHYYHEGVHARTGIEK